MNWKIWKRPRGAAQWQDGGIYETRQEANKQLAALRLQGMECKPEFIGKQRALIINPKHLGI